jgi:hypothetical protein
MNKVIKVALESKFPSQKGYGIDHLLEVIGATPNPTIATEILLGIYEEPLIPHKKVIHKNDGELTFISYDKWLDKVDYSYKVIETKNAYFPKSIDKSEVTLENFDTLRVSYKENEVQNVSIPTGNMLKRTSYVSLETWNSYPAAPRIEHEFINYSTEE